MQDDKWPAPEDGEKGWKADPTQEGRLRHWDGENWTQHTHTPEKVAAPADTEKGWKPDPTKEGQQQGQLRYWDGDKWTLHTHQPKKEADGAKEPAVAAAQEPAGKKQGTWQQLPTGMKIAVSIGAVLVVIIALADSGDDGDTGSDNAASTADNGNQSVKSQGSNNGQAGGDGNKGQAANEKSASEEPGMTPGQENALRSAEDYLDYAGFSKAGLIDQLSSPAGEGYSKADATFAANNVDVDWNAEAVEAAKDYLDYSSFSKQGLIEQLSSSAGEQFTLEQAQYGANVAYSGG